MLIAALAIPLVGAAVAVVWSLDAAAPAVDRTRLWTDSVVRGEMIRAVRGAGRLIPERSRWIVAETSGRIERVHVQPGESVGAGTVLVELSNPDVQIERLNAERQLSAAEAELRTMVSELEGRRLEQEARVAGARTEYREARRQLEAATELAARNLIAANEVLRIRDRAEELATRLSIEERRLAVLTGSASERVTSQRTQVQRLHDIAEFQHRRATSMRVVAGAEGIVQDLTLEIGQWVMPGHPLARVVDPGRLKAELNIPETQARDLAIGQRASIDTRNGIVSGRVVRIDPSVQNGAVVVDVSLEGELPRGARPDLSVDGVIEIERLANVLHVGRPAHASANSRAGMWKLVDGGAAAERVQVRFGRSSVNSIEVLEGLDRGDVVILSDVPAPDGAERIRLQ